MDHKWDVVYEKDVIKLNSPKLLIDDIYRLMGGTHSIINIDMNPDGKGFKWVTGFG